MQIGHIFRAIARTAAAISVIVAAPVLAQEPLQLAPSSQWFVKYNDESCRMMRQFGTGENRSVFIGELYGPGSLLRIVVAGKPFKPRKSGQSDGLFQFGPDGEKRTFYYMPGEFSSYGPALMFTNGSLVDFEIPEDAGEEGNKVSTAMKAEWRAREDAIEWLRIDKAIKQPVVLELGLMAKPMAEMRKCTDGMLETWGIDPEKYQNKTRTPEPTKSPARWLSSRDYPVKMLRKGEQGIVHFRLAIDENGKPDSCHIQRSTRPQEFDDAVCNALMNRARFKPALDAEGLPMRSFYQNTVRFMMP